MSIYKGITSDSREVKSGYIFVAIRGTKMNGELFINDAIKNGTAKIVVSEDFPDMIPEGIEIERVQNPRKYLSMFVASFYKNQPDNIVAVTGTSGKTSTAFFFKQICELSGHRSACIGTLGVLSDFVEFDNNDDTLTSPNAEKLHNALSILYDNKITHVAIEASSHGIHQYRIDGVRIKAAAFTNFTQDHLDYHDNMEEYFKAKLRLFTEVILPNGFALINADILQYEKIRSIIKSARPDVRILSYGRHGDFIELISIHEKEVTLKIGGVLYKSFFNLEGSFQIYNLMAAIGLANCVGFNIPDIINTIPNIIAAPGRMQKVATYNGSAIFVDYSHKPDALEKAILALKSNCKGRFCLVFGCGGDRDYLKRPIMGGIAGKYADVIYVTDDNPRTENPKHIRSMIIKACPNAYEYEDRAECIKAAIKNLNSGDTLLIAGKGHEDYQIIKNKKHHFSDIEEVLKNV
jgi:UDP-N-acetylmuramoyl-L-alanyl-D-glutamate--2,6-diaminopimelate ligase